MCPNQGSEVVLLRLLGFGTFLIQILLIKPPLSALLGARKGARLFCINLVYYLDCKRRLKSTRSEL